MIRQRLRVITLPQDVEHWYELHETTWPAVEKENWNCVLSLGEEGGKMDREVAELVMDFCFELGKGVEIRFMFLPRG